MPAVPPVPHPVAFCDASPLDQAEIGQLRAIIRRYPFAGPYLRALFQRHGPGAVRLALGALLSIPNSLDGRPGLR